MFASGGFSGLLSPPQLTGLPTVSAAPTPAPANYGMEIRQTVQLIVDNWPLVKVLTLLPYLHFFLQRLMSIENVTWRNIINTNISDITELLPAVLAADPAFLHYFTMYVAALSDPSVLWDAPLAKTRGESVCLDTVRLCRHFCDY